VADLEGRAARTTAAGIHCLRVPTPFAVGDVNVYLIDDEPLTLVDSGPAWTESLEVLEAGLENLGHSVADIDLLLVTHQHADHLGLTRHLAAASGADIACIDPLATYAAAYQERAAAGDRFAAQLMSLHGVPDDTVAVLERVAPLARNWGAPFTATRLLASASPIELRDRTLRVIHAPGHSPTDTLFLDETNHLLFSGDHLLAGISSNALISPGAEGVDGDDSAPRRRALVEYIDSLRATRELDVDIVLGGHGRSFTDHRALIDGRLTRYGERAEGILALVRERPRSAHELAEAIWGKVAITQAFLTLSEILGHIDLLLRDGLVAEEERVPGSLFYAAV
jgi:glyoxylase-like metal-dependent hydrolase (beta-lactamase superfamily II)